MKFPSFFEIPKKILERYQEEYYFLTINSNLRIVNAISKLLLVVHLFMLFTDFYLYQSGKWQEVPAYQYLFYSHLLVFIIYTPTWYFSMKKMNYHIETKRKIVLAAIYATISWAMLITFIDQFIHQNITVIMICTLVIATTLVLKPKERILLFLFTLLLFLGGMLIIENESAIKIGNITNGSIFILFSFAISKLIDNYHRKTFSNTKLIEEQNLKLRQYNEELQQFSYVVSHDMKAPLRTISSFVGLLDRTLPEKNKRQEEFMGFIKNGAENMSSMIDDLLTFTALGQQIEMEPLEMHHIITLVKNNLAAEIQDSNAQIIYPEDFPKVKGIKPHIILLFQNLISNALKYHSESSPIVDISYQEKNKEIEFKIKDNGIGISSTVQDGIFNLFSRGDHNRSDFKGTGIGLAICKKIIQNMNGKIWVNSIEGKGSSFYFTIPT